MSELIDDGAAAPQHTFGGLGFGSRFIDFEVSAGGDAGGAADAAIGEASFPAPAIPAADDAGLADDGSLYEGGEENEGQAEPPAAPAAWTGPSQDEWQQMQQFTQTLQQLLEQEAEPAAPAAPAPPDYSDFDPSDPEQMQALIDRRAEQLFNERMGPYQPILDQQAQAAGEKMVNDTLDTLASELGEFDRNQALLLTNSLLANGVEPQQAMRQAASIRIADEQAIATRAVEDYKKQMGQVADVPAEPAGHGEAQPPERFTYDPRDPDKYEQIAANFMARKRRVEAAGNAG